MYVWKYLQYQLLQRTSIYIYVIYVCIACHVCNCVCMLCMYVCSENSSSPRWLLCLDIGNKKFRPSSCRYGYLGLNLLWASFPPSQTFPVVAVVVVAASYPPLHSLQIIWFGPDLVPPKITHKLSSKPKRYVCICMYS